MSRVLNTLEWVLDKILLVLFAVMVFSIVYQVFARYVLERPTAWSEELARFHMVAITMLGSAYVVAHKGHVDVTLFVDLMPRTVQKILAVVRDLLIIAMGGILAWYGAGFAEVGARRMSSGLHVPMLYPYLSIGVGGGLIALFVILRRFRDEDPR
ncbi:TRAP transporter small permease [Acuticoccus sp. M5D2P5]|uniref:TRAP transporter small permease n=1 Tax=Acuticoccus kalidii TaxID=2910977 RepID=UPI001F1FB8B8|nr:TRAP transporter small permease [Acuticoccus kalidii]MCF3933430.1 TRAP transporter small permease [Acuticoccus kalidii]